MNYRIALIDCSIPINTRNQKIIDSFKKYLPGCDVHVITWNREIVELPRDNNFHAFNRKAPYANALAKIKGMYGFRKFIGKKLKAIRPDVIIASHWSNLILTSGFKEGRQKLIYENLDIPTGGRFVRLISRFLEYWSLQKVDLIVHASRFFGKLYPRDIPQLILENKPVYNPSVKEIKMGIPLKISFIGNIRYKDILMNLVTSVKNDSRFELYFHGSGSDLSSLQSFCAGAANVYFTGKYEYSKVVSLYHQSDIIWAGYPNKDFNVVYAISNKFHESLYVGVPCIYSEKTMLADFVKKHKLGFVVDPYNVDSIRNLLNSIYYGAIDIAEIKHSMKRFQKTEPTWDEDFKQILNFLGKMEIESGPKLSLSAGQNRQR